MDYKLNCINISIRKGLWLVKDYSQTTFLYFHFKIRKEGFFECPHVIKSIVSFRNVHLFAFEDLGGWAFAYSVMDWSFTPRGELLDHQMPTF